MGQRDLLKSLARLLDKYNISYLLTGSLAVSYYGIPRATHDIDFIIEIQKKDSEKILKAIKSLGKSYLSDKDQIKEAISKSSQFELYHPETGIKIDFWIIGKTDFERNKLRRGKKFFIDKQKIQIISCEDLILTKLSWCKKIKSERHIRDCAGILKIQADKIDKEYIHLWAKKLKVSNLLQEASSSEY